MAHLHPKDPEMFAVFEKFEKELKEFTAKVDEFSCYQSTKNILKNMTSQFEKLKEEYGLEIGKQFTFTCWINREYLEEFYDQKEMSRCRNLNLSERVRNLNHLDLTSDDMCEFDNEAWGALLKANNDEAWKMLLTSEGLEEWKQKFPDSLIIAQEFDDEYAPDGRCCYDEANAEMMRTQPHFNDYDKYYCIGNEAVCPLDELNK